VTPSQTDELREVWVCVGCDVRSYHASGRPIPQPAKWEDERCPKCRLDLAFDEGGNDARDALARRLGLEGRYRSAFAKRGGSRGEKPKPKPKREQAHRTSEEADAIREKVREVVTAHPDWNGERVGKAVGITTRTAIRHREYLGLKRQVGPTDEQRKEVIRTLLIDAPKSDEEIAKAVGVKTFTVTETRKKIDVPPYRTRLREDRERRVAEAAVEHPGWGANRIADAIGEPLNNVRRTLDKLKKSDPAEPVPAAS
jgi:hypothetical protein